uniref:Uncharacterized protein n=1 Tax=Siphoviridae sp. ctLeh52 TaxID=2827849 RepID=A0A8S5RWZ7_9CAUD|nr:MAG TPA: hypothetical protein [Siphoviridae sp. ctLeh52]
MEEVKLETKKFEFLFELHSITQKQVKISR